MKKIGKLISIFTIGVFALTGCSKEEPITEKISCTTTKEQAMFKVEQALEYNIIENKLDGITLNQILEYFDEYTKYLTDEKRETLKKTMIDTYSNYEDVTVENIDKGISIVINFKNSEMDSQVNETIKEKDYDHLTQKDIDEIKKSLEEDGYTCK